MTGASRIEDLKCWQEARILAIALEDALRSSPPGSDAYLCDQLRRAVISISSNIAEGFARFTPKEFHRFLRIARASCIEMQSLLTHCSEARRLDPPQCRQLSAQCEKVTAMITRLMRYLRDQPAGRKARGT